ncbi:MAG: hypothetical protein OXC54_00435 [Rhodospirillaceae bacterium]|nr:hypothetical protein [Rhodospirillaceae bacterium]
MWLWPLLGFDGFDEVSEMTSGFIKRTLSGVAHRALDFGECLLDRVTVGRVGRQELTMDIGTAGPAFVEDDVIAGLQGQDEKLPDRDITLCKDNSLMAVSCAKFCEGRQLHPVREEWNLRRGL